jgi:hypothetical protein
MVLEKVEQQMNQILNVAKQVQNQVQQIRSEGFLVTRQGEIKAREFLHQVFDSGLTLLGQGIVLGRKATESFVAETHRKANKLKKSEVSLTSDEEKPSANFSDRKAEASAALKKNSKFKSLKNKKQKSHLGNTARAH